MEAKNRGDRAAGFSAMHLALRHAIVCCGRCKTHRTAAAVLRSTWRRHDAATWNGSSEPITDYAPVRSRILANQSCSFLSSSSAEILGGEIENVFIQGDWQHVSFPFSFLQSWKSSETIVLYYIFIYIFIFIFLYFYIYIYIYLYYNFVLYLHYLYNLVLWYYIVIL